MPWKVSNQMDERVKFISRLLEGERMTDICKEFGISRKTGYKFRSRYLSHGIRGLVDNSKRPDFHPHKTPETIEKLIVKLRPPHMDDLFVKAKVIVFGSGVDR